MSRVSNAWSFTSTPLHTFETVGRSREHLAFTLSRETTSKLRIIRAKIFSCYQLCQRWVKTQYFRDLFCFHHHGRCPQMILAHDAICYALFVRHAIRYFFHISLYKNCIRWTPNMKVICGSFPSFISKSSARKKMEFGLELFTLSLKWEYNFVYAIGESNTWLIIRITVFVVFVRRPEFWITREYNILGNWICFCPQVRRRRYLIYLVP
jgi:hypothetical protein